MVRVLHVVTLSDDGRALLLAADANGRPTHRLAIDARLTRVLRGQEADASTPALARMSPRDIQARLRGGASVEEVAAAAGVPAARVERFAGPIRSEQDQVVRSAQACQLRRARAGRSAVPLAAAVATNLAAVAGVRFETVAWSAARQPAGDWVVTMSVTIRGRQRMARWRYSAGDGEVTPLDTYAGQIGFVEPTPSVAQKPGPDKPGATKAGGRARGAGRG